MTLKILQQVAIISSLALCSSVIADNRPQQMPEVGTNIAIDDAVQLIWKIRATKKWGEALMPQELAAVTLGLEAFDDQIMQRGVGFFTPQFFDHLFPGASKTRVHVTSEDRLLAGYEDGKANVEISMGLLAAYYWTQLAVEEARENVRLKPYLADYLFALSRNNFQRTPLTASSVIRLTEFVTGTPWHPDSKLTNAVDERAFAAVRDALVFTVAHEGCHVDLRHRHLAAGADAVRQEWEADACATARAGPPGMLAVFNPYLVLSVLALVELDDQRRPKSQTTHPSALCRMAWMIYNGGNMAKSIENSLPLFPLLVDLYRFRPLSGEDVARIPTGYDQPNFVAAQRIASSCGGWKVINPRAFEKK